MERGRAAMARRAGFALLVIGGLLAGGEGLSRWAEGSRAAGEAHAASVSGEGAPGGGARVSAMRPDPALGWRLQPGPYRSHGISTSLDADGQRIPAAPAPPGAPVVLTVGDSSIFGHGVADGDTLHDQLQSALAAKGTPAAVQPVAVPGYSSEQSLRALASFGWDRKPALLVVASMWSDANYDGYPDATFLDRRFETHPALSSSALLRQLGRLGARLRGEPTERKITWPGPGRPGVRRVPLDRYVENLQTLVAEARAHEAGVVFLTLANRRMLERPKDAADWSPYLVAQAAVAEAYGVPRVDASVVLASAGAPASLFVDDLHPSAAGHAALAAALAETLAEAGWPANPLLPSASPANYVAPADPRPRRDDQGESSMQRTMLEGSGGSR